MRSTAASLIQPEIEAPGAAPVRTQVRNAFLTNGIAGVVLLVGVTLLRQDETSRILVSLGEHGPVLIVVAAIFSALLASLKFELTNVVYVSLVITAYAAMFPLLGAVLSGWIAVLAAMVPRLLAMVDVGPVKANPEDLALEAVKTFGLFGTYGIPVVTASMVYTWLGGEVPLVQPTWRAILNLFIASVTLIVMNTAVMNRVMVAYGYDTRRRLRLAVIDGTILLQTLPFSISVAVCYGALGVPAVIALGFTGVVMNLVARRLAAARIASQQQLRRLASLSNIGKTISIRFTTEELLRTVYEECRKVVDVSLFTIALYDQERNELSFELEVQNGHVLPKSRMPIGTGLNSWVIERAEPLLITSQRQEARLGVSSIQDGAATESWLGVPMIARDRVIGVISLQSYRQGAFSRDDLLLLTAVANQTAVALENATLYRDLEGLTMALEQRVQERATELRETNLRLLAADRSKNQFLANMSHELRTPLNSIVGFSSVLLETTESILAPRLYKFLENIRTAGLHLLELINDILDLSKIEAGKMELRLDTFDPRDTIAAVERVMRSVASEAKVKIRPVIGEDVPHVRLDEGRLKQILFNLLSNAVKFSPPRTVVDIRVTYVRRADSPLHVDSLRIEIRDEGIGIAEVELKQIFDEFYQTEEGRKSSRGGTGLGLSLTRNFVELHHGTIDVQSTVGQGTIFSMYLPVDFSEVQAQLPGERGEPVPRLQPSSMVN